MSFGMSLPKAQTPRSRRRKSYESSERSQNCILRMSDDKTMQLIELYEKEECLWNTRLESYKNREKRAQAAENIARVMNIPNFEARHVVIKFKNLRNSYCQELKKISNSMNSGVSPDEIYRPKVFWFSKMHSFLRPHLQPSRTYMLFDMQPDSLEPIKTENDQEEECWVQLTNPEDVLVPETSTESEHSATEEEENVTRSKKASRCAKKRKLEEDRDDDVSNVLKQLSTQIQFLNREEDYYDNFGKYIASLLRSLPKEKAFHLQPKIVSLITNEGFPQENGRVSQSDEIDRR